MDEFCGNIHTKERSSTRLVVNWLGKSWRKKLELLIGDDTGLGGTNLLVLCVWAVSSFKTQHIQIKTLNNLDSKGDSSAGCEDMRVRNTFKNILESFRFRVLQAPMCTWPG